MDTSTTPPLLSMKGISKAFPGVQALSKVDLDVKRGEVVALMGENGAGKSTLMKILAGAYEKDDGRIFMDGCEVTIKTPLQSQDLGVAIMYQEFNLTCNQSAAANIFLAREPRRPGLGRFLNLVDRRRMESEAQRALDRIKAGIASTAKVEDLSIAQRQMVEVAKALVREARLIIMDEPTAALGEREAEVLFGIISQLKLGGVGVIFISHRMEEVVRVADRIVVMRDGRMVGEMSATDATAERIIQLMVGRPLSDLFCREKTEIGGPILEARGLTRTGWVKNVSFSLRRGEILGFAGLIGAGRTETARLLFGADRKDGGEILIEGKPVSLFSPLKAVDAGVGLVPEDRGAQGLVLKLTVRENIVLSTLKGHAFAGWIDRSKVERTAADYVGRLQIRTPHLDQKVVYLSGGNQQKVVLAKWLASRPKVLILDEPTRGVDVGAKAEIHSLMNRLAKEGMGIIMISSEMPEILGMSDRIVVMYEGEVAAILDRAEATQELIMSYASGQVRKQTAGTCA
jgi:ribose transport system ATP-binding protein